MLKIRLKNKKRRFKKTEEGMALVEAVPVLFAIVVVFNISLGFFGAVHSGILNSIASYNYALETFRFRSNLMYFRPGATQHYQKSMNRVHGVIQDGNKIEESGSDKKKWPVTVRHIAFNGKAPRAPSADGNVGDHEYKNKSASSNVWKTGEKDYEVQDQSPAISEIWIKTVYGICLNAECKKN